MTTKQFFKELKDMGAHVENGTYYLPGVSVMQGKNGLVKTIGVYRTGIVNHFDPGNFAINSIKAKIDRMRAATK
jgi:hypothetical protein